MKSEEYKRGYDAGYKQALRDALTDRQSSADALKGRKLAPRLGYPSVKFGGPMR
jgi:hypothetical protein